MGWVAEVIMIVKLVKSLSLIKVLTK